MGTSMPLILLVQVLDERACQNLVAVSDGIAKDEAVIRAAIPLPWSNGQTEGQVTKLKLVKRPMCGRGHLDLLQARLIGAECQFTTTAAPKRDQSQHCTPKHGQMEIPLPERTAALFGPSLRHP